MSDNIDVPVVVSGGEGIDRITSSIDRLAASMSSLGSNSAIDRLAAQLETIQTAMAGSVSAIGQQLSDMQAVMTTRFADLAATSEKMLGALGNVQVKAIEQNGDKTVASIMATGNKIKVADARTWEQIQKGSAANVTAAFAQLAEGIDIDAVLARFGELATGTALAFDGQLAALRTYQMETAAVTEKGADKQLEVDRAFHQAQLALASRAAADMQALIEKRDVEEYRIRSEASAQLKALIEKRDMDEYQARSALAADLQALIEKRDLQEYEIRSAASARLRGLIEKRDVEEYQMRSAAAAELQALIEKRDVEEYQMRSAAAQKIIEIEQRRDTEIYNLRSAETLRLAEIQQRRDMEEFAAAQAAAQRIIGIEQQRDLELHRMRTTAAAEAAAAAQSSALKNASYTSASPASQIQTQIRAVSLQGEGLNAADYVGAKAAADAQGKSIAELRAQLAALRVSSTETAAAQFELEGALRQAEGAFRGAAHQAGIYGLHHGQLIALLAGGAVAAALHHIAETGAEVEYALASFPALAEKMHQTPVDLDSFINISSGTIVGMKDAAEGMHALAEAGRSGREALAMLPDVMRLAAVGGMSVAHAAELAVESMHAFGKTSTEIGQVGDVLVAVASMSNVSVQTLANDMKSAATSGQMFGMTMEETAATVGVLAQRGLTIQPLSSALMKIYEPSAKGAAAIKQLGLEVRDVTTGAFRPYVDVMDDLSKKMNEFSSSGIVDTFKAIGFSSRDIKSIQVMTADHEEFEHILHRTKDAAGLMFDAMAVKSDTTKGAFEILGSTLEGAFARAFEKADPAIRQVEDDLLQIVSSSGMQDFLTGLATGFANLAHAILENRTAIEMAVAGYLGLRLVPPIMEALSAASAFLFGQTVVATTAITAEGAAATLTSTELVVLTEAEIAAGTGAETLALEAGLAETMLASVAVGARVAMTALGPLALIVAGVSIAFQLFHGEMAKDEAQHAKMNTSIDSTIQSMEKEIERLDGLQKQLELTGKTGEESAYKVQVAFAKMAEERAKADLDAAHAARTGPRSLVAGDDGTLTAFDQTESAGNEAAAEKAYKAAHERAEKLVTLHDSVIKKTGEVKIGNDIHDLETKIKHLTVSLEGLAEVNPDKAHALEGQVKALAARNIVEKNYADSLKEEKALEDAINSSKRSGIVAPDKGSKNAYKADVSALQEQLTLAKQIRDSDLKDVASENKRGELGDLSLINEQLRIRLEYDKKAVAVAQQERAVAAAAGAKPAEIQKYTNKIATAKGAADADDQTAVRARADLFDKMESMQLQAHAQTLAKQGRLDEAFDEEWEVKYGKTMSNIENDLDDLDKARLAAQSDGMRASLDLQKQTVLASKKMYENLYTQGKGDAIFKMDMTKFDQDLAHMHAGLADLARQSGPGTGLSSTVTSTFARRDQIQSALPGLQADYAKAKDDAGTDPAKLKAAEGILEKIKSETANLNTVFVSLGETIAQSLTAAFGKGGAALGGMITTATQYDAKMKEIATTLAGSDGSAAAKKAAADATASAQIKAYGNMAGAAKGFFDVNSNGYKIMAKAEQAYRVIELAMSAEAFMKKVFFKESEVAVTAATTAENTAIETAGTGASLGNAGAQASAWGLTAVVKSIASMSFPMNLVAGAVTMAAIVGLGVKLSGGMNGGGATSEQRQAEQGTGTVLGAPSAKSDSIAKSIELTADNSSTQISYLASMASSLSAIQTNITGFASQLIKSTNITGKDFGNLNSNNGAGTTTFGVAAGAAIGAYFGPIGAAIGAFVGLLAKNIPIIGKLATSIFGGKQTLTDSGFQMSSTSLSAIQEHGAKVGTYADITTSGGWFKSDKSSEKNSDAGDEVNKQFTQVILSLGDAVKAAGTLLGENGDDFTKKLDGFVVDIGKVSLKGKSGDEIQKELEAVFSKVGDQMAQAAIPNLAQFQQVGEGYLETLTRVATDYAKLDASLESLGMTFGAVGLASVAAREDLIKLVGGADKFQSTAADFATNFLTKAAQQAPVLAFVKKQMDAMNLGWVETRQQFADVVLGLNLTTEAGRQTYASLMGVESAFAATHVALKDTSKTAQEAADERSDLQDELDNATMTSIQLIQKQRDALDESNRALFDQVQALKDQATAAQKVKDSGSAALGDVDAAYSVLSNIVSRQKTLLQTQIDAETKLVSALTDIVSATQSALDSLAEDVPEDAAAKRRKANVTLDNSLSLVKSGATLTDDQNKELKSALSQLTKDSKNEFATSQDYLKEQYETKNKITDLHDSAKDQLTAEQQQLDNDKAQLKAWDQMLSDAKDQIDQLKGIGATALSIDAALAALAQKIAAAQANPAVQQSAAVTDLYKTVLGRTPDSGGMDYWTDKAAGGMPIDQIKTFMENSAEAQINKLYQSVLGRPADAAGMAFYANTFDKSGGNLAEIEADLKASAEYGSKPQAARVPHFALGGDFDTGGVRLVGENGPELEATGPSRIWNHQQLTSMLAGNGGGGNRNDDALVAEIRALRQEVAELRKVNAQTAKNTKKSADMFETATGGGGALLVEFEK